MRYRQESAHCGSCPCNSERQESSGKQIITVVLWNKEIIQAENTESLPVIGKKKIESSREAKLGKSFKPICATLSNDDAKANYTSTVDSAVKLCVQGTRVGMVSRVPSEC